MEPGKPVSIRRCAIYTRKSSEESGTGLQFTACPARSLRGIHKEPGWRRMAAHQNRIR